MLGRIVQFVVLAGRFRCDAFQVADRWHWMENFSHAFLAVRKFVRPIRVAIGAAKIDPNLFTAEAI